MSRKENDPDTAEVYTHTVGGPMPHLDPGYNAARQAAHAWMDEHGWDTKGRIEIPVAWGQQDIFNHINNVHYSQFVESSRIHWLSTLVAEGHEDLVDGKGTGIILKDQIVRFRAPVTYPDSLIWAVRPHSVDQKNARFVLSHAGWSLKDNRLVATADSTLVIFDYAKGRKGEIGDDLARLFAERGKSRSEKEKAKL